MDKTQMRFALDAHRRGWHIFPCEPGEKVPALLYPGTNRPGRIRWPRVATNDVTQIIQWWTTNPLYNIGVACKASGLMVIDCDIPKTWEESTHGWDQFRALCERRGVDWEDTVDTYQVETQSKGVHLYYWCPPGVEATQAKLDSLIDVRGTRGDGGYVLGAGSQGSGWYHCVNPAPVRSAPTWLVEEVTHRPVQESSLAEPFQPPRNPDTSGLRRFLAGQPEGSRNIMLNRVAYRIAVENPGWSRERLLEEVEQDALEVGLTIQEIKQTVDSAYRGAH